ncbi:MAG: hypothetical protein VKK80_16790 [Prochlorothrix sp.]|nr:hypothetical protein [Prochlorothrix sp.]
MRETSYDGTVGYSEEFQQRHGAAIGAAGLAGVIADVAVTPGPT